jgi:predicted oxidoreductase
MYKGEDGIVINTDVVWTYTTIKRPYNPVWQLVRRTFRRTSPEWFCAFKQRIL